MARREVRRRAVGDLLTTLFICPWLAGFLWSRRESVLHFYVKFIGLGFYEWLPQTVNLSDLVAIPFVVRGPSWRRDHYRQCPRS